MTTRPSHFHLITKNAPFSSNHEAAAGCTAFWEMQTGALNKLQLRRPSVGMFALPPTLHQNIRGRIRGDSWSPSSPEGTTARRVAGGSERGSGGKGPFVAQSCNIVVTVW